MSLSKDDRKKLNQLNEYFKKIEKLAVENNIDLDVYMNEYKHDGFEVFATEKIGLKNSAENRKKVFEKNENEKKVPTKNK
jgi:hypothetical protein